MQVPRASFLPFFLTALYQFIGSNGISYWEVFASCFFLFVFVLTREVWSFCPIDHAFHLIHVFHLIFPYFSTPLLRPRLGNPFIHIAPNATCTSYSRAPLWYLNSLREYFSVHHLQGRREAIQSLHTPSILQLL